MSGDQEELFASVDALLERVAVRDDLPEPAERRRLREVSGLSQDQVAGALGVRRETVTAWETGRTGPRPPKRAAYARLLEGLAERHPAPAAGAAEAAGTAEAAGAVEAARAADAVHADGGPADGTAPSPQEPPRAPEPTEPPAPPDPHPPAAAPRAVAAAHRTPPHAPVTSPGLNGPASDGSRARTPHGDARPPAEGAARRSRATRDASPQPGGGHGPLGVLDGDGSLYCAGGLVLDCPARDVPALAEWVLAESGLGAPRLHRFGKDGDPLVVLTASATALLGLPPELADRRALRLPDDHPVVRDVTRAKWRLTRRGFGPWPRVYRPARAGQRQCVQFAVLPWGALDARSWGDTERRPAPEIAGILGTYAERVITPRGSTAVCGLELMTALRPPTRPERDPGTGEWRPGPVPGSLTAAVDPAPPEAPSEHPVAAALFARGHRRGPADMLDEEAHDWIRDPQLLTDAECARSHAVGIDVNTAFLAAANRLDVGLGAARHVLAPRFDPRTPGSWFVDLSGIELDPRLPGPFTPHGGRPEGPAWYATPTVAYAWELIEAHRLPVRPEILQAWLRPEHGGYLDPWYQRLSEAYKATMADLGVLPGTDEAAYLAAMERHRDRDPAAAAVLAAVKSTVKGGIGKLRERPQGAAHRHGQPWPALERPTWRPDIRAAVVATARVNMHRKILRTALATQTAPAPAGSLVLGADALLPVAVLSDCAVYLSDGPSPLDVLPRTPDGRPAPGTFRLGVSPGMVKHEGTRPLLWAVQLLDEGHNPARHIKDDAV